MDLSTGDVVREAAAALVAQGAEAVVLVGSEARGDAHARSDIDLYAIGAGPAYRLEVRSERLVSVSWRTLDAIRASLAAPEEVCQAVPAWAGSVILHDPNGTAAVIQGEARAFDWANIADACDACVPESLCGFAEEALKLRAALDRSDEWTALVQRDVLALGLASLVAVHRRLLFGTENVLWAQVAEALGPRWRAAQSSAFAQHGESVASSCAAALGLFALAAAEVDALLNERQRAVIRLALESA